jgi:hypothetical protein
MNAEEIQNELGGHTLAGVSVDGKGTLNLIFNVPQDPSEPPPPVIAIKTLAIENVEESDISIS